MDSNRLSQRLLHVAQHVPAGARLADIGSDHAYLPVYLAKKGFISYAIAGEVVKGPYQNATKIIEQENVQDVVHSRLADGLEAYSKEDRIDTITICGMGGPLMVSILSAAPEKLATHPLLILQPNVGADAVRGWLEQNCYQITQEEILSEAGHIYEIIVAEPVINVQKMSRDELFFGPFLMQRKEPAFVEKWTRELRREEKIFSALTTAKKENTVKYFEVKEKIKQIKGVLYHDNSQ